MVLNINEPSQLDWSTPYPTLAPPEVAPGVTPAAAPAVAPGVAPCELTPELELPFAT